MQFFKTPNINFMETRRRAMIVSAVLLLIGMGSVVFHGGFKASIDFSGGALVEIQTDTVVPLQDIRDIVSQSGFSGAEVTNFGQANEYLIKVKAIGNAAEVSDQLRTVLEDNLAGANVDVRRVESVGPKIGSELRTAAIWAILYSLFGIIVYVSWRFEFRFAVAAIIALVHDVLFTLGLFSIIDLEVSLAVVAAILTIVGYSLNDTIVVFDRIRENLHTRRRDSYAKLVNSSINETLSRTLITSLTTLIVVIGLVLFGGEVIRDFAVTLLIGVLVGTYSSIFIASPVLVEWQMRRVTRGKK